MYEQLSSLLLCGPLGKFTRTPDAIITKTIQIANQEIHQITTAVFEPSI